MKLKQIRSFPKNKSLGPERFSAIFYQTFNKELIPSLLKIFHEIEREGSLLNSFNEASITLNSKSDKAKSEK
jgi:hypothetical protein